MATSAVQVEHVKQTINVTSYWFLLQLTKLTSHILIKLQHYVSKKRDPDIIDCNFYKD